MSTPCAACKYLRRKCTKHCVFAPYFPANKQEDYAAVHKVFGASHVATVLNEAHPSRRREAMTSLVYEAKTRLLAPIHGCSLHIYSLQNHLKDLEYQLQLAKNELASYDNVVSPLEPYPPVYTYQQNHYNPMLMMPVVSSYGGQLTAQQLQEEAHHRDEYGRSTQQTHADAAFSKRDDCP